MDLRTPDLDSYMHPEQSSQHSYIPVNSKQQHRRLQLCCCLWLPSLKPGASSEVSALVPFQAQVLHKHTRPMETLHSPGHTGTDVLES